MFLNLIHQCIIPKGQNHSSQDNYTYSHSKKNVYLPTTVRSLSTIHKNYLKNSQELIVIQPNVQCLSNKILQIEVFLTEYKLDFLLVSEHFVSILFLYRFFVHACILNHCINIIFVLLYRCFVLRSCFELLFCKFWYIL